MKYNVSLQNVLCITYRKKIEILSTLKLHFDYSVEWMSYFHHPFRIFRACWCAFMYSISPEVGASRDTTTTRIRFTNSCVFAHSDGGNMPIVPRIVNGPMWLRLWPALPRTGMVGCESVNRRSICDLTNPLWGLVFPCFTFSLSWGSQITEMPDDVVRWDGRIGIQNV